MKQQRQLKIVKEEINSKEFCQDMVMLRSGILQKGDIEYLLESGMLDKKAYAVYEVERLNNN